MFDGLKTLWKGVKNRMFGYAQIKDVVGEDFAMSSNMFAAIDRWKNMLDGNAPWVDNQSVVSLEIESGICREFADVVLNEMEIKISNKKLEKLYLSSTRDLNENFQEGLGLGSFVIKPLSNGKAEFLTADKFVVLNFDDDGKPIDILFIKKKEIGGQKHYTRTERHYLHNGNLTIENRCFFSGSEDTIGKEVPLTEVPEWANIIPGPTSYIGMKKMDFGYFRAPLKNRVDGSDCGVSIFSKACRLIKKADIQYGRIEWEYESGERAIHVDDRALNHKGGQVNVEKLNKRLYRGLNLEDGKDKELFREFSPEMRDEAFIRGLERIFRQIEFVVGLSYGDLSNINEVEKTAAEIRASKQRKYNRVMAIQENLKECLTDFVDALAFHNGMYTTGYSFTCNFNDSILTDEEADRQSDRQDVSMGALTLVEYRMRWYGETEEEARKHIVQEIDEPDPEEE